MANDSGEYYDEDEDEDRNHGPQRPRTSSQKVSQYELIIPLLSALYTEFKTLSGKKPDATINKMKVAIVNRLLDGCRLVLADEPELVFLDLLDDESLPQTSDALIVLSQYVTAMKQYRDRYYYYSDWQTEDQSPIYDEDEGEDQDGGTAT